MKNLFPFAMMALMFSACFNKKHNDKIFKWDKHKKLVFLTYGMPIPGDRRNAENVIANKWGFYTKSVAGCIVTKQLTDSVADHNKLVQQAMNERFGKGWDKKFEREVARELTIQQKVIVLLDKLPSNIKKRLELEKEGNGLHYYLSPAKDTLLYNADAEGWGTVKGKYVWVSYYRYLVDVKHLTVKILSDTIRTI